MNFTHLKKTFGTENKVLFVFACELSLYCCCCCLKLAFESIGMLCLFVEVTSLSCTARFLFPSKSVGLVILAYTADDIWNKISE